MSPTRRDLAARLRSAVAGLRNRLRGKGAAGKGAAGGDDALGRLLAGYPPNRPRHPGNAAALSPAEQDANLAQFLAERGERIGIVSALLRADGVEPASMLDPDGDGVSAARAVDRWLDANLPRRTMTPLGDPAPNPDYAGFRASDRAGPDIFYSLLADLALLEGEAIRLRDGRFAWAVNRLKGFRTMPSYGRVCLIKPGARAYAPTVLDGSEHLLAVCHSKAAPPGYGTGHWYGEWLDGAVRRAFDP